MKTARTVSENWGITLDSTIKLIRAFGVKVTDADRPFTEEEIKKINEGVIHTHSMQDGMTEEELKQQKLRQEQVLIKDEPIKQIYIQEQWGSEKSQHEMESYQKIISSQEKLRILIHNYTPFIDTCSLLESFSVSFLNHLIPVLQKENKKLILSKVVYNEFEHVGHKNSELKKIYEEVFDILVNMSQNQLLEIYGDATDIGHADNVLLTQFTRLRMNKQMLLITQDKNLSSDILHLNELKAIRGYPVKVQRINKYGYLSEPVVRENHIYAHTNCNQRNRHEFRIMSEVSTLSVEPIKNMKVPGEGEQVYTKSKSCILLGKKISNGGEGAVYYTDTDGVAKIYFPAQNNEFRKAKLERMLSGQINHKFICWPEELLYNRSGQFVGYLMKEAKGIPLEQILGPIYIQEEFPDWTKKELIELAYTVVNTIDFLHEKQIILGDINLNNFLVVDSRTVYFVDTDSYQIDEFPCPVGTLEYIPPELQGKNLKTVLRTMENENFSVATLIFMILMLGKKPYDKIDSEGIASSVRDADFSYPNGGDSNGKAPKGPWRYIWSHLSHDMKKALYEVFRKGEAHYPPENRYSSAEWKGFLRKYLMDYPGMLKNDPKSALIKPDTFKRYRIICKKCGSKVFSDEAVRGICQGCLDKGESYQCKKCGGTINYTYRMRYVDRIKKPELCDVCTKKKNTVYTTIECMCCHKTVTISELLYEDYKRKNKALPCFCRTCTVKTDEVYEERTCVECGDKFDISYKAMRYYVMNRQELPKRCSRCLKKKHNSGTNRSNQTNLRKYDEAEEDSFWSVLQKLLGK